MGKMATEKKKLEEKQLKTLRAMVALPHNRHCFDCNQRGPTYVNMTIGCYVCTACSGVLRGLNPPHRVKSVSMASFTPEEIELLTQRGNEYNREVWLGLHDTKRPPDIDTKDEIKLRDYMTNKYEKKRWFMAPADGLADQAKKMNTTPSASNSNRAGLGYRSIALAGQAPRVQATAAITSNSPAAVSATPAPIQQTPTAVSQFPAATSGNQQTATDLLSDVFAASSSSGPPPASFQANFAAFGASSSPANNTALVQPISSTTGMNQSTAAAPSTGNDANKYAAFADLFSSGTTETPAVIPTQSHSVEWNSVNWSGSGTSSAAQSTGWNMQQQASAPPNIASAAPVSNMWGVQSSTGSQPAPQTAVNPFLVATPPTQQQNFGTFGGQSAYTQQPMKTVPQQGGFPGNFQQPQQQPSAMFPTQAAPAAFGASFPSAASNGAYTAAQGGYQMQGSVQNKASTGQWGAQANGNFPTTSVNPFMAQPVQQPTTTNPFL